MLLITLVFRWHLILFVLVVLYLIYRIIYSLLPADQRTNMSFGDFGILATFGWIVLLLLVVATYGGIFWW